MKSLLTNANAPPEQFESNRAILEVADVFVPLLKQPLDYLKVPSTRTSYSFSDITQVTLQLGKRDWHKKLLKHFHHTSGGVATTERARTTL
jgi:hypothetical protein